MFDVDGVGDVYQQRLFFVEGYDKLVAGSVLADRAGGALRARVECNEVGTTRTGSTDAGLRCMLARET